MNLTTTETGLGDFHAQGRNYHRCSRCGAHDLLGPL